MAVAKTYILGSLNTNPITSGINQKEDQKRFAINQDTIPMGVVKISFNCSFITFLFILGRSLQ